VRIYYNTRGEEEKESIFPKKEVAGALPCQDDFWMDNTVSLARLAYTMLFATLGRGLAFTASLGSLVVCATTCFGQNAVLLNLTVKTLEGYLEGVTGVDLDLTHGGYQRDLRSLLRPDPCAW